MAVNEVVGRCACPLCKASDAEVRKGEKGKLYIVCDECVSMFRTQSRRGQALIGEFIAVAAPVSVKVESLPVADDAPLVAAKKPAKKNSWLDGLMPT